MLWHRILTALVLIPVTLILLIYLPPFYFLLLTGFITLAAGWEWAGLMQLQSKQARSTYLILMAVLGVLASQIPVIFIIGFTSFLWLLSIGLIAAYPKCVCWQPPYVRGIIGFFVLIPCWIAINYIRNQLAGVEALIFLFVLIWGADSAAYFAGKLWGKHKLAPLVSPGKSIEGICGAFVFALLLICILLAFARTANPLSLWIGSISITLITVLFSIVGDLFESMLKRHAGLKDSGQLLPGHGGLLDRIDSLTSAAPIFAFGCWIITQFSL